MVLPLRLPNNKSSTHRSCTVIRHRVMSRRKTLDSIMRQPRRFSRTDNKSVLAWKRNASAPFMPSSERYNELRKSFKTDQTYADMIWKRYTLTYLPHWKNISKWSEEHVPYLKEGELECLVDDFVNCSEYKLGRMIAISTSESQNGISTGQSWN